MRWLIWALTMGAAGARTAVAQTAKAPVEVQNARVFEHRTGSEQSVHMSPAFFAELQKAVMLEEAIRKKTRGQ